MPHSKAEAAKRWRCIGDEILWEGIMEQIIFDIFKRLRDGKSLWITTVEGLEEARKRITRLASIAPGEYFIYSQKKGVVEYVIQ